MAVGQHSEAIRAAAGQRPVRGVRNIQKISKNILFQEEIFRTKKWIFMWISRITREIFRIKNEYSCEYLGWPELIWWISLRISLNGKEYSILCWGAIQMNISKVNYEYSLKYSEMEWISKWISNTSRNEDWIFKRIIKIWMNIQLNIYLNIQRHLKWREYSFKYSFEYSLPL